MMYHLFASISKRAGPCLSNAQHESVGTKISDALNLRFVAALSVNQKRIPIPTDPANVAETAGNIFEYALAVHSAHGLLDIALTEFGWLQYWCFIDCAANFIANVADFEIIGTSLLHPDHEPHFKWFVGLYNSQCANLN